MSTTFFTTLLAFAHICNAHMSIFTPAAYGWMNWPDDPQSPLVDLPFEQWWFRGYTDLPTGGKVEQLEAGGVFTAQIACHYAWTTYGDRSDEADAYPARDACPSGDNAGPYHSSLDPTTVLPDIAGVSGCALAIADKDDIKDVGMNDLTVFSVNHTCVYRRATDFKIPAAMPSCTGSKCICVWLWLANYGQSNFYMTGFDCSILQSNTGLKAIGTPQRPLYTGAYPAVVGPKLPFYGYNDNSTIEWFGNDHRPGYHAEYGFNDGAQDDIFTGATIGSAAPAQDVHRTTSTSTSSTVHRTLATSTITSTASTSVATHRAVIEGINRNSAVYRTNVGRGRHAKPRSFGHLGFKT